jgi:hypothetical protein
MLIWLPGGDVVVRRCQLQEVQPPVGSNITDLKPSLASTPFSYTSTTGVVVEPFA